MTNQQQTILYYQWSSLGVHNFHLHLLYMMMASPWFHNQATKTFDGCWKWFQKYGNFFKYSIFVRFFQFCVKVWKISRNLFGSVCKQGLYMSFVNIPVDGPCVRLALLFIPACVFFFVCLFCLPLFGSSVASWGSVNLAVSSSSWERRFLYSYERYLLIFLPFFVLALSRYWCWRHLTVRVRSKPFSNARCVMIEKPWTLHQYKLG